MSKCMVYKHTPWGILITEAIRVELNGHSVRTAAIADT